MSTLAERALEARLSTPYHSNRSQFARAVGVSPQAIQMIEEGTTKSFKAKTLAGYVRVTGYSVEWLQSGRGPKFEADRKKGELSHPVRDQREMIAAVVRLTDYVRDVALEPIPEDRQEAIINAAIEVVTDLGTDALDSGDGLADAAKRVAAVLRSA